MSYYSSQGVCRDCNYFEPDRYNESNKGYCSYYRAYYYPGERACSHMSYTSSGGCYITTIVHDILGKDDKSEVLQNLREFRNDILQKDSKYAYLLYEYDNIGPMIADCISKDNDKELCSSLYNKYLKPISIMIKEKKYLSAIVNYQNLTSNLAVYYNVDNNFLLEDNYNYSVGGHGKVKRY